MKKLTIFIASVVLSLPVVAAAEGGYQWEKQLEKKTIPVQAIGNSAAAKMGHTAVEHKRMMIDTPVTQPEKTASQLLQHQAPPHYDHMAADHKRQSVGSNH